MSDATQFLKAIERGEPSSANELLPLVYEELRRLAAKHLSKESPGQTLQPTALVHEAYVRLIDEKYEPTWDSKYHFFSAAAEAMRRILVERARKKLRKKHGGGRRRVDLNDFPDGSEQSSFRLLALNEALDELQHVDPEKAQLVKLRYFAGMSLQEAANALGISRATASRHWTYSKAWLYEALDDAKSVADE